MGKWQNASKCFNHFRPQTYQWYQKRHRTPTTTRQQKHKVKQHALSSLARKACMGGSRGGTLGSPPEKSQNIGFLCNTGPDPLKIHKATKPAFNVGPSSARQRNAMSMAFRWRACDGPIKNVFGSSIPFQLKKHYQNWNPSDETFWIRA